MTNSPVVQSTVAEVLEYILTDLKTAQALLKPVDPIGPSFAEYNDKLEYGMDEYITDDGFWLYRKSRLNYYGVTALMARVYLCQENLTDALACAQEVIDSKRFEFMNDSICFLRISQVVNVLLQKDERLQSIPEWVRIWIFAAKIGSKRLPVLQRNM